MRTYNTLITMLAIVATTSCGPPSATEPKLAKSTVPTAAVTSSSLEVDSVAASVTPVPTAPLRPSISPSSPEAQVQTIIASESVRPLPNPRRQQQPPSYQTAIECAGLAGVLSETSIEVAARDLALEAADDNPDVNRSVNADILAWKQARFMGRGGASSGEVTSEAVAHHKAAFIATCPALIN